MELGLVGMVLEVESALVALVALVQEEQQLALDSLDEEAFSKDIGGLA